MANWDDSANKGMTALKQATNASDQDMNGLRQQINAWANGNANGSQTFAFAPLRMQEARVRATTSGGWIKSITYGDKV